MNDHWARLIIHHLIEQGVSHFCLSPGSRSTPLAWAVSEQENVPSTVHFDERGAAFYAYGIAKARRQPAVIIVTSGSALGNLFPAVMEAFHDHVPLIILTADRSSELHECGANQTCHQTHFFGTYVRWSLELPTPDPAIEDRYLSSTIAHAVFRAQKAPAGPVHLNWKIREPFFSNTPFSQGTPTHYETGHPYLPEASLKEWASKLGQAKKGLIIAGESFEDSCLPIIQLSEKLRWPLFADVLSGIRSQKQPLTAIPYFDSVVKTFPNLNPDCVLHFGGRPVSKTVALWLKDVNPHLYVHVDHQKLRQDPFLQVTHKLDISPSTFCSSLLPLVSQNSSWLDLWKEYSSHIETVVNTFFPPLSEPGIVCFLHQHLPSHFALFLANSMPIRDADQFFFPSSFEGPIYGKRGLSGIDGCIATACGLAEGSKRPTVALIGDLSMLHDLNSLALVKETKSPIIFIVINNQGGGIFHFLPIVEKQKMFEKFVASAHTWDFSHAAAMFDLPYQKITTLSELEQGVHSNRSILLEIPTNRVENAALHHQFFQACLPSLSSTAS